MENALKNSVLHWSKGLLLSALWLGLLVNPNLAHASGVSPVGGTISSPFGWRTDPMNGSHRFHGGIDIAAASGMPVYAPQSGKVVFSGAYGGYGNVVVLDHGNTLYTLYGHNSQLLAQAGQYVERGQLISRVGSTGRSTGPHLHFEVHYNQQYLDPRTYLNYLSQSLGQEPSRLLSQATPAASRSHASDQIAQSRTTQNHAPQTRTGKKRRSYPRSAYGHKVVQVVNGTDIQNVEF